MFATHRPPRVVCAAVDGRSDTVFEHALKTTTQADTINVVRVTSDSEASSEDVQRETTALFERYRTKCEESQRQCQFQNVIFFPGTTELFPTARRTEVGSTICLAAQAMRADELLVGYQDLSAINRMVMGSVSEFCAHRCPLPTTIVKTTLLTDTALPTSTTSSTDQ